jgi:hypothetical protein
LAAAAAAANNSNAGASNNKVTGDRYRRGNKPGLIGKKMVAGSIRNVYKSGNGRYFSSKNGSNGYFVVAPVGRFPAFSQRFNYSNNRGAYNKLNTNNTKFIARNTQPNLPPAPRVTGMIGRLPVGNSNRNVYKTANNRYFATRNGQPNANFYLLKKNGNKFNYSNDVVYNKKNLANGAVNFARREAVPSISSIGQAAQNAVRGLAPNSNKSASFHNWLTTTLTQEGGNYSKVASSFATKRNTGNKNIGNLTRNTNTLRNTNAHRQFWNALNKLAAATSTPPVAGN